MTRIKKLTVASFSSFKRQEDVFRAFTPEDEVKHSNDPPRVPLKFDGGSENFFTGSLTGSESKIHRSSYYQLLIGISASL